MSAISIANGVSALLMEIEVVMTGSNSVNGAIATIARSLNNLSSQQIAAINTGFVVMAAVSAAAFAIINEGLDNLGDTQDIESRLRSFAGSYTVAANQMALINELALDGVFNRDEWSKAIVLMDQSNLAISKNLTLLENLGARLHNIDKAAQLLQYIQGAGPGPVHRVGDKLMEAGITPEMLAEHGVKVVGRNVLSGKEQLMKALREIAETDEAYGNLTQGFHEKAAKMSEAFHRMSEAVIKPLAPFLGFLIDSTTGLVQGVTRLQNVIHFVVPGFAGLVAVLGVIIRVISFFVNLLATVGEVFQKIGTLLAERFHPALEKLKTVFQPVTNFFNWLYNWFKKIFDFLEGRDVPGLHDKNVDKPGSHADNPVRHDDVENLTKRLRGFGWNG